MLRRRHWLSGIGMRHTLLTPQDEGDDTREDDLTDNQLCKATNNEDSKLKTRAKKIVSWIADREEKRREEKKEMKARSERIRRHQSYSHHSLHVSPH
jgi:hypothetical protein